MEMLQKKAGTINKLLLDIDLLFAKKHNINGFYAIACP